jgi:cytochrome P450
MCKHVFGHPYSTDLDHSQALQTLDESLYANLDVTANATAWAQILLAQDPNVQTELREEIQSIDNSDSAAYANYINSDTTFLAACILESSRVRPILRTNIVDKPSFL